MPGAVLLFGMLVRLHPAVNFPLGTVVRLWTDNPVSGPNGIQRAALCDNNRVVSLEHKVASDQWNRKCSYAVVPSRSGVGVSLLSIDHPNRFLRYTSGYLDFTELSAGREEDFAWTLHPTLNTASTIPDLLLSMRPVSSPDAFLYSQFNAFRVQAVHRQFTAYYKLAASFLPVVMDKVVLTGKWSRAVGYAVAIPGATYSETMEVGVVLSQTTTTYQQWTTSLSAGGGALASLFGDAAVSTEFSSFVASTTTNEYSQQVTKQFKVTVPMDYVGGLYVWQWQLEATNGNVFGAKVGYYLFYHTKTNSPPDHYVPGSLKQTVM